MKIFICGVGRSGTTYLKELLNAHPDVFIPTECLFLADYLRYRKDVPLPVQRFFFFKEPQLRSWFKGSVFKFRAVEEAIDRVHTEAMRMCGAQVWGQKTPRFVRHVSLFNSVYEDIKWVFIYRDPRSVAASMLASKRHTYSVKRACKRWLVDNKPIFRRLKNRDNSRELVIKYEDFIQDFDRQLEKLFLYLDLKPLTVEELDENFSPAEYVYSNARFKVNTVRNGLRPNTGRVHSFKAGLKEWQIKIVEYYCQIFMQEMGYTCMYAPQHIGIYYKIKDFLNGSKDIFILFQYLWKWPSYLMVTCMRKIAFITLSRLKR